MTGRYIKKGALRVDRLTQLKAEYRPDPATPRQLSALLDLAEFFEESVTLFDPDAESFQIENYIQAAAYMLKVPQQFTQGQLDAARRIVKEAKVSGMVTRTATVKRKKRTS